MSIPTDQTFGTPEQGLTYRDIEGAYLVLVHDGLIGAVRSVEGHYFLLGGDVQSGESHEACILRDCLEGIGYDVRVDELIASTDEWLTHPDGRAYHALRFYYSGELLDPLLGECGVPLHWIPTDHLQRESDRFAVRSHLGRETSAAALAFIDGKHEFYG